MLGLTIGRVFGDSMLPRIAPDSFIICSRWLFFNLQVGQMYYIQHPVYGRIVKTLVHNHEGKLFFRGESEASVSTKAMGALSEQNVIGRVIWIVSSS